MLQHGAFAMPIRMASDFGLSQADDSGFDGANKQACKTNRDVMAPEFISRSHGFCSPLVAQRHVYPPSKLISCVPGALSVTNQNEFGQLNDLLNKESVHNTENSMISELHRLPGPLRHGVPDCF